MNVYLFDEDKAKKLGIIKDNNKFHILTLIITALISTIILGLILTTINKYNLSHFNILNIKFLVSIYIIIMLILIWKYCLERTSIAHIAESSAIVEQNDILYYITFNKNYQDVLKSRNDSKLTIDENKFKTGEIYKEALESYRNDELSYNIIYGWMFNISVFVREDLVEKIDEKYSIYNCWTQKEKEKKLIVPNCFKNFEH